MEKNMEKNYFIKMHHQSIKVIVFCHLPDELNFIIYFFLFHFKYLTKYLILYLYILIIDYLDYFHYWLPS